ncbi:MAG: hypothetical protein RI575_11350 [Balneolaceae bacterium]|nr:hypothetical protein [Balneolaceae bacterium]MDR9408024.1 hypothetical protein [Balneolaceae bacterium]
MKKLTTLLLVLVFAGTTAFAQNTADVDQVGIDHEATVDQVGSNDATINQNGGNTNLGFIDQEGDDNTATILQPNINGQYSGNAPEKAKAYQYQRGNGNEAAIRQAASFSDFAQQDQWGTDLVANVKQGNNTDAESWQKQRGTGHNADTRQSSSDNAISRQEQHGNVGDGNVADTDQINSDGASSDIYQDGDNYAKALQRSARGTTSIDIDQFGQGNSAIVNQGKAYVDSGNDLTAIIYQDGMDNMATINQSFNGHTADINQSGSLNDATVSQQ